jgi:tRNA threonylcarbamoyl adenosine modification protein (Sua5/YciO/YrdC/YwlC family)
MPDVYDLAQPQQLLAGMREARGALGRGDVIVMPTDTVYGIAANAFEASAVAKLLAAKGRDRTSPPPVLVAGAPAIDALASEVPDVIRTLVEQHWPGPLTVILPAQPSLQWDLGETHGTVALRIPNNEFALELLKETGPLAVSSANKHGQPAPANVQDAVAQLGDDVQIFLDAGVVGGAASTIIDATGLTAAEPLPARIVRAGALSRAEIAEVLGDQLEPDRGTLV